MSDCFPQTISDKDLAACVPTAPLRWLWHGFVAEGNLTLLTSMWKSGKTTLVSLLLSRRVAGGKLLGQPVTPGKTVVISEEDRSLWAGRIARHGFGGNVCFFLRPFRHIPSKEEWQTLIDRVLQLHERDGIDLVVIDPVAPFIHDENLAHSMYDFLHTLSSLTQRGMAVLVLHHPKKGKVQAGQSARGSGALLGHVDISIEMRHPGGDIFTRRRRFLALSRHAETPRRLLLELNHDGNDYAATPDDDDYQPGLDTLLFILADAPHRLTRNEILAAWPPEQPRPNQATLWKWLDRAGNRSRVDIARNRGFGYCCGWHGCSTDSIGRSVGIAAA
ncbi:MAG: AAA family ATPase [Planctomycetes bacterium]|nr:AAA family ATPase [Planctomycetota bacterium]